LSLTIFHFLMDLLCITTVLTRFGGSGDVLFYALLLYNFIAFMGQPFIGFVIDRFERKMDERILVLASFIPILVLGVLAAFYNASEPFIYVACAIFGLGNAIFHVAAGKLVLKVSNKSRDGGIFVSSGALGIALGSIMFRIGDGGWLLFIYLLVTLIAVPLIGLVLMRLGKLERNDEIEQDKHRASHIVIVLLLIAFAALVRSFGGFAIDASAFDALTVAAVVAAGAFAGKFIGGFIYDRYKGPVTIVSSLVISGASLICLFFFAGSWSVIFLFFFSFGINQLMAYTLYVSKSLLPKYEGTAFGLPAAMLFPGMLIAIMYKTMVLNNIYLVVFLLINTVALLTGELLLRKKSR